MSIDLPDPTSTPPPTPAKCNPQPKTPRYVPTRIKDTSNNFIKISTEADPTYVVICGEYDVWYFEPNQSLTVAHAILGCVNEITGQRYSIANKTNQEKTS